MVEMEENGGTFHDWGDLIGSPNRLISEEFPFEVDTEKIDDGSVVNNEEEVEESGVYNDATTQFPVIDGKVRSRGSIAERRAAKCGFSASRINVARFRATSPLSSPSAWSSPFLTIPAGISPTALLDSPIMLPNSQPSPTTGTLPLPPLNHEAFTLNSMSAVAVGDRNIDIDSSFTFQPHGGSLFWPCISDLQNQPPMLSEFPAELSKETATKNCSTDSSSEVIVSTNTIQNTKSAAVQPIRIDNQVPPLREPIEGDDTGKHLLEEYQKETYPPTARTSEDGYNWRKYGQKQVKGSEYPRSYYKCTHPNCPVKKKVERSHDGQITEIIYKGAHNHHIPHLNQRTILGSPASLNDMSETGEANGSYIKIEGGEVWRNIQLGCNDIKVGSDWRADGLEGSSSTSVLTDISDPLANTQGKSMGVIESATTPELSSTNGNRDGDDEDGATLGTLSPGDDASEDKSEFKRRKKGSFLVESNLLSRAMREPRVVVQIESEVDILDDGYRWRKYGQKVVKGNPNPRSYYKCTSAGCSVRKHVERASDNLKAVLTTYEGKHNHEVPAARNSSHANMDVGNLPPAHNTHPNLTLPRISNVPKSQAQVQDLPFRFERKFCNDNYMTTSNLVGNFVSEASSIYQGKFVPFQNSMSFGSTVPSVLPNFNPMSLPMSIPSASANMVRRGFGFNNPIGQVQSYVGGQQFRENNSRFLKPKQEQDDNIYDTFMPVMDHANDSSSRYCRVISNFQS